MSQSDNIYGVRQRVCIEHVSIRRLAGILAPFELQGMVPGLNIVLGPNASGKSRTATAIQALVWPKKAPREAEVHGQVAEQGRRTLVEVHRQAASYSIQGQDDPRAALDGIPNDHTDRYLLTLADLLLQENKDLAEEIQRESSGGYDIVAARTNAEVPKSAPKVLKAERSLFDSVRGARKHLDELRAKDGELHREEGELQKLDLEINEASHARDRNVLIGHALELDALRVAMRELEIALDEYPEALHVMDGTEVDRVAGLTTQILDAEQERQRFTFGIQTARQELESLGVGETLPHTSLRDELLVRAAKLGQLTNELRNARYETARGAAARDASRQEISSVITEEQAQNLDLSGLAQLIEVTYSTLRVNGEREAVRATERWIGDINLQANLDSLRSASSLLADRLQHGDPVKHRQDVVLNRGVLLFGSLVIIVLAMALAIVQDMLWVLAIILALLLIALVFRTALASTTEAAADIEHRYTELGLDQPDAWTVADISRRFRELNAELAKAEVDAEKYQRWQSLGDSIQHVDESADELQRQSKQLATELGLENIDADWPKLQKLASDIRTWRDANTLLLKAQTTVVELERESWDKVLTFNACLEAFGLSPHTEIDLVNERATQAQHQFDAAHDASRRLQAAQNEAGKMNESIESLNRTRRDLYRLSDVTDEDFPELQAQCERFERYRSLLGDIERCRIQVQQVSSRLEDAPELREMSRQQLDDEQALVVERIRRRDTLVERRQAVRDSVARAKHATIVESALAEQLETQSRLGSRYEEMQKSIGSWQDGQFIQGRSRELNRPEVFRLAEKLFRTFTHGSFELEMSDDLPPVFQARETSTGHLLALGHLSSGTRVQLLMAVRLAFIECNERGTRLPLLLDETLGNSDDLRARAIMDATIEICRAGRQVVYFTAQREEVRKWERRIAQTGEAFHHKTFNLGEIRDIAGYLQESDVILAPEIFQRPPLPEGLSHEGAREFFRVGPIDPWLETLDSAHMWYFISDVSIIDLLAEYGVRYWGQYIRLFTPTIRPLLVDAESVDRSARNRHRAIDVAVKRWRTGRCRNVTIADLEAAPVVTQAFLGRIEAASNAADWNAVRLLEILRTQRIRNFTEAKISQLQEYFQDSSLMPRSEPDSDETIRAAVLAAVRGDLSEPDVDYLLQSISFPR